MGGRKGGETLWKKTDFEGQPLSAGKPRSSLANLRENEAFDFSVHEKTGLSAERRR
jgi:hypothetical protein